MMDDNEQPMKAQEDNRVWMYRRDGDGKVESQLFGHPEAVPQGEGWQDTPPAAAEAPKKRRGRPPKQAEPAAAEEAQTVETDDEHG